MEIGFWRYLYKEHPGLPLKQRIPEVAIFSGHSLQDCYYSNQRGLLQKRTGTEVTREALLDRLLALASKRADGADLSPDTPAAILRRPPPGSSSAPHVATVLSTSELMDLLKQPLSPRSMSGDFSDEWSLQSIVAPAEDLRTVAVYSRGAVAEERIDVIGRSYQAMYRVGDGQPIRLDSASSTASTALAVVPELQSMKVEAKAHALVQYVQHFHQRVVEGLLAEFVQDAQGRLILHGFWKISLADPSIRPVLPDSMLADGTGQAFLSSASATASTRASQNEWPRPSSPNGHEPKRSSSVASTSLPGTGSIEAGLGQSLSTEGFGSISRPTSATFSRPTSASRERPSSAKGQRWQHQFAEDPQDIPILEDDDVGGDDDIDAEIERLQADRSTWQTPQRSRVRPTHTQRPAHGMPRSSLAQSGQARLLLELWDGGRFLGEAILQPDSSKPPDDTFVRPAAPEPPEVLELGRPQSIRADVRKDLAMQDSAGSSACAGCWVSVLTTWDQKPGAPGALRLRLLCAKLAGADASSMPQGRHVRAQLWSCCPHGDGFECRPMWTSVDAIQSSSVVGSDTEVLAFEWPDEAIDVCIPAVPTAPQAVKKRPFSARARVGPRETSTPETVKMRPASARLSRRCAGSTERLIPDQRSRPSSAGSAPKRPCQPSTARPQRPTSAQNARPSPPAAKPKLQRPSSARSATSVRGTGNAYARTLQRGSSSESAAARTRASTDAVRKKQTLHSKQLLSRYQMERDNRTRLISILTRQLERSRDMMATWVEQRNAIRVVVARADEQVEKRCGEVERLLSERAQIEKFYLQKQDAARCGLSQEQEKAVSSARSKKKELEEHLELERKTTLELMQQEHTNDDLKMMLDQTVAQLENAQSEVRALQAKEDFMDSFYGFMDSATGSDLDRGGRVGGGGGGAGGRSGGQQAGGQAEVLGGTGHANPSGGAILPGRGHFPEASLLHARARLEAHLREKEQTTVEMNTTKAEILKGKEDLEHQREQRLRLEDFVRRMVQHGSASTGYLLDPAAKREAAAILASASKMQAARLQRPASKSREATGQADMSQETLGGRRCAACDEYDVRWQQAPELHSRQCTTVP